MNRESIKKILKIIPIVGSFISLKDAQMLCSPGLASGIYNKELEQNKKSKEK